LSASNKSKDAEDILSEFQGSTEKNDSSKTPEPEPQLEAPDN